jgi:hypothetical protein
MMDWTDDLNRLLDQQFGVVGGGLVSFTSPRDRLRAIGS